ncbi:unnamed protein product [Cylicocyclus nassatus]|uniref:DUF6273 domain-containing protein n=1 Tax=Cylicocyclus nassatus TaxID=53992 RepID=A0AA36DRW4_CYLNA|nr:unnamed protein product [Cylicocyclus nassatus]
MSEPNNNVESILTAILKNDSKYVVEPQSRVEELLLAIYKNGGGGASSADKSAIDEIKDEFYAVVENLEKLETAKNDIAKAITSKGVEVAEGDGLEKFPELIRAISDGYPLLPSDLTYNGIAKIVRSGKAEDVFKIGDQIVTTYTDTDGNQYDMPFDVVAFREVELENGSKVPGMIIQSHYATVEEIQFDAPEPSSSDSIVKSYGWNRWMYSGIRQWLNSSADKGLWWTSTHTGDVAPSQLSSVNGFMKGFSSDFISMLKKTKHETALNHVYPSGSKTTYIYDTTYDVFFLPSAKEEHFKWSEYPNRWDGSDREGSTWEYWIQRKGETPQDYGPDFANTNTIRYSLADKSTAKHIWLRSANRDYSSYETYVHTTGYYTCYYSNSRIGCAPACVISPSEAAELEYLRAKVAQMDDTVAEQDELLAILLLNEEESE